MTSARLEWPPGSGRRATYGPGELRLFAGIADELAGLRHRRGCPGAQADDFLAGRRDLEGCPFCRCANQIDVLHELQTMGARLV